MHGEGSLSAERNSLTSSSAALEEAGCGRDIEQQVDMTVTYSIGDSSAAVIKEDLSSENYHISSGSCRFSFENKCAIMNEVLEAAKEKDNEPEES